jgi:hypothetical protein
VQLRAFVHSRLRKNATLCPDDQALLPAEDAAGSGIAGGADGGRRRAGAALPAPLVSSLTTDAARGADAACDGAAAVAWGGASWIVGLARAGLRLAAAFADWAEEAVRDGACLAGAAGLARDPEASVRPACIVRVQICIWAAIVYPAKRKQAMDTATGSARCFMCVSRFVRGPALRVPRATASFEDADTLRAVRVACVTSLI